MSDPPLKLQPPDLDGAVRERYGNAAQVRESARCPTSYDPRRDHRESKGVDNDVTTDATPVPKPGSCC